METNSGKVGKMRDKFRKGGGKFRKNDRISDPKGGILAPNPSFSNTKKFLLTDFSTGTTN